MDRKYADFSLIPLGRERLSFVTCPDADTLVALSEGTLDPDDREAALAHVADCEDCSAVLATAVMGEDMIAAGTLLAGRYEVIDVLGRGGMGVVYRVRDRELDQEIALKTLSPNIANNPTAEALLKREVRLGRSLASDRVCKIYDVVRDGEALLVTMALVEGQTLHQLIRHRALTRTEAVQILDDVLTALSVVHGVRVIHRDLKPSNVMIDSSGRAVLMDFGLARVEHAEHSSLFTAQVGTPGYWSPEQARGDRPTSASDVYAFGRLASDVLHRTEPAHLRQDLKAFLARCVDDDPAARFADAPAAHVAFRAALARPRQLRLRVAFGGLLALATVVLGVIWTLRAAHEKVVPPERAPTSVTPLQERVQQPDRETLPSVAREPSTAPPEAVAPRPVAEEVTPVPRKSRSPRARADAGVARGEQELIRHF